MLNVGDLVFVRGTSLIDVAIEDITRGPYSHVALAMSFEQLIEAQCGEPVGYVPASKYAGSADVHRSALPLETIHAIVANASDALGEHYGYGLIVEELVREETGIQLPVRENKHTICSVLVSDAIRRAGIVFCPGIEYPAPSDEAQDGLYRYFFSY